MPTIFDPKTGEFKDEEKKLARGMRAINIEVEDGKDGLDGKNGKDGAKGDKGDRGEKGDKGDAGKAGREGIDGKDGLDGKDGVSIDAINQPLPNKLEVKLTDGTSHFINIPKALDAKPIELQTSKTHFQWRYQDGEWRDLAPLPKDGFSATGSGGGTRKVKDLRDVTITNVTDGQVLAWSDAAQAWINDTVSGSGAVDSVNGQTGIVVLDTGDVDPVSDRNYVTDAQQTVIGNTSGTNSGNETTTTIGSLINGATGKTTPVDADYLGLMDSAASNVLKKLSWANVKATLKSYFDTLYPSGSGTSSGTNTGDQTNISGNAATATTATNGTVANEATDTTCFPLFVTDATGDLPFKSNANFTFDSSTGVPRLVAGLQVGGTTTDATLMRINSGVANGSLRIGADVTATTFTINTRKIGRIVSPNYADAGTGTNCFMIGCDAQSGSTGVDIGGTSGGTPYAATTVRFYTAPTITTTGGTLAMTINSAQSVFTSNLFGVGITPSSALHLGLSVSRSAWSSFGPGIRVDAATYTDTSSAGPTIATANIHTIAQPTIAASNAITAVTNAATLYIANAPTNGTNVTAITNPYAIWVDNGNSRFDGKISLTATETDIAATSFGLDTGYTHTTTGANAFNTVGARLAANLTSVANYTGTVAGANCNASVNPSVGTSVTNAFGNQGFFQNTGAGTLSTGVAFNASNPVNSGGGAITTSIGFRAQDHSVGTNIYGFRGTVASGATKWNLFMDGTAQNSLAGFTGIGFTTAPGSQLQLGGAVSAAAWGAAGISLSSIAATYTDTSSSGTVAIQATHALARPTLVASSSTTYTDSATLYIANAPLASTNVTQTTPWALWIDAGDLRLDGSLGSTGARVTKGWFTDIESTNAPTVGGTSATGTGGLARAGAPSFTTTIGVGAATAAASGAGITFPATASVSTDPNTLDDYEEGTWTPTLTFTVAGDQSIAYSNRLGTYTKVGKLVTLFFNITTSTFTHTTASGNILVQSCPFQNDLQTSLAAYNPVAFQGITKAGYTQVQAQMAVGGTQFNLNASGSAVAISAVTATDMPTAGTVVIRGTLIYNTNS